MSKLKVQEVMEEKLNPRSIGIVTSKLYNKRSEEISLEYEADELARCAKLSLKTAHVLPVELYSYEKSSNTLSTKIINGDQLYHTLWNPTSLLGKLRGKKLKDIETLTSRIIELGHWLNLYHESTNYPENADSAIAWLQSSISSKAQGIRVNHLMKESKINSIEKKLMSEVENLKDPDYINENHVRFCQIHGDFIIYNMLIDANSNIHILDFGDTRRATNIDDVARFYSNLWAISQTNNWRKNTFSSICDKFLISYGLESSILEKPYFKTMMAYNFLIHLYGQFCMRHLLSFVSNMELSQVTKSGIKWVDKNLNF